MSGVERSFQVGNYGISIHFRIIQRGVLWSSGKLETSLHFRVIQLSFNSTTVILVFSAACQLLVGSTATRTPRKSLGSPAGFAGFSTAKRGDFCFDHISPSRHDTPSETSRSANQLGSAAGRLCMENQHQPTGKESVHEKSVGEAAKSLLLGFVLHGRSSPC